MRLAMPREILPLEPNPVIEAYKKDVDRTLLRESLALTWDERARQLVALIRAHAEFQRAGARLRERVGRE
jgi:hypothetical protein